MTDSDKNKALLHIVSSTDEFPLHLHNNSAGLDSIFYGAGLSYFIPTFRGKSSIDPVEMVKYIEALPQEGLSKDPTNIKYQDVPFPWDRNGPAYAPCRTLADEIMKQVSVWTDMNVRAVGNIWSISHGYKEQTYAHDHAPSGLHGGGGISNWAVVYWAQVPEGSGELELYPKGLSFGLPTIPITPVVGDFFVFPGDLLHGVRQNVNETEKRVSVSLNLESYSNEHWLPEM